MLKEKFDLQLILMKAHTKIVKKNNNNKKKKIRSASAATKKKRHRLAFARHLHQLQDVFFFPTLMYIVVYCGGARPPSITKQESF